MRGQSSDMSHAADVPEAIGSFNPGLPNGRRREFEPLPRRTSPKPWDAEAMEAHWRKKKGAMVPGNNSAGGAHSYQWREMLGGLQRGESMEVNDSHIAVAKAVSWHGPKLGYVFEVTKVTGQLFIITRVR